MAYIGTRPTVGNFVKLDTITTSATTTFNLLNGGVAYYPQSPNHCLVSLNGILQAPTDSFTISGSTIIFSSALTTSDVIDFIIVLGDVLNIGTPSDNTVSLAKLTATGTKDATTFLRGDNTFAVPAGGVNTPAFMAYLSSNQSVTSGTYTKAQCNTEVFDLGSCYDNATNYRFTPNVAGKYMVFCSIQHSLNDYGIYNAVTTIRKNGSDYADSNGVFSSGTMLTLNVHIAQPISFNGTTDYVELWGYLERHSSTGDRFVAGNKSTYFGAYKIIE